MTSSELFNQYIMNKYKQKIAEMSDEVIGTVQQDINEVFMDLFSSVDDDGLTNLTKKELDLTNHIIHSYHMLKSGARLTEFMGVDFFNE